MCLTLFNFSGGKGGKKTKKRQSSADEDGTVTTSSGRKSSAGAAGKAEKADVSLTVMEHVSNAFVMATSLTMEYRAYLFFAVAVGTIAKYGDMASV